MKYRSRTEIIGIILHVANKGASKTRIMYGAYLSHAQVKEYLDLLLTTGLLTYEEGTQLYRLTERGINFLRAADEIRDLIGLGQNDSDPGPNEISSQSVR